MTHYIVKHSGSDYRLHAEDGTEPTGTSFSQRPDTNDLADDIAAAGPAGRCWEITSCARRSLMLPLAASHIVTSPIPDETVPWQ
jgi:hypothetical protein